MRAAVTALAAALGAGLCATGAVAAGLAAAEAVPAPGLADLAGRWSGWGSIRMESGAAEQVKCVVTYVVPPSGSEVTQNLRCASQSFRIDAVASLGVKGADVVGRWEERTYDARGSVSGRLTESGLSLSITGDSFSAAMAVAVAGCKQSITIAPRGFEIQKISVGLEKC